MLKEIRLTSSVWANGPFLLEDPAFWGLCLLHTFSEVCFRCLVANALRPWCCWAPVQSFCEGFWLTLLRWSFLVLSEITFLLYLVHTNAFSCSVSLLESSWFILFYYRPQPTFLTKGSVTRIRPPSSLVKPTGRRRLFSTGYWQTQTEGPPAPPWQHGTPQYAWLLDTDVNVTWAWALRLLILVRYSQEMCPS